MSSSTCSGRAASAPGIDRDEDTSGRVRLHEETFTESLSGASKNLPGNTEHEAWSLIDSLQVEDILTSLPPRFISNLPLCLRSLYALINLFLSMLLNALQEDQGVDFQDGGMNTFEFYLIMKSLLIRYCQCVIPLLLVMYLIRSFHYFLPQS